MKNYPKVLLEKAGIPVAYGSFETIQSPPFITFVGTGQETYSADNIYYLKRNTYQVEYYYKIKDEELEDRLEEIFTHCKILYEKSEDIYIEDDDMWVIYYEI